MAMTWTYWVDDASTSSDYYADGTWSNWTISTSASTSGFDSTWTQWQNATTFNPSQLVITCGDPANSTDATVWMYWIEEDGIYSTERPKETEEQRQAREEREEQARIQAAERERKRKEAEEKAREALIDNLDDEQLKVFERIQAVPVTAFRSGDKYLIRKGRAGNVDALDKKGRVKHRLCFHPSMLCPDYDTMLAQKLMLEMAEEEALRMANVHPA